MTSSKLTGKKIAIVAENGFEEVELTSPRQALQEAGATVHVISRQHKLKAWDTDHWSIDMPVDVNLDQADSNDYDALMIPGGVLNLDKMRMEKDYVDFAAGFLKKDKPVAAICHGPQLLIETGMMKGKDMTSYPSLKTDMINAGINWQDKEVVKDHRLITSRSPKDLPAFNREMIKEFAGHA